MNIHLYLHPKMRVRDENKIETIRQKAIELIVKEGFDGLSMQKLAKAANVSPATIYIYFKDREDLIFKVATDEVDKMISTTLNGFDPKMSFSEGLIVQWKNRANYCFNNPLQSQFMEQVKYSPIGEMVYQKFKKEFSTVMGAFVKKAVERKELVPLPMEVYWSIAFAPLYQLVKFRADGSGLGGRKFVWDDNYMKLALQLVLKALKP